MSAICCAFSNKKELAVWLGITPRQYASGETNKMGGSTKRGDSYLRTTHSWCPYSGQSCAQKAG
ncbi:hypothetical protein DS891_08170 [Pseudoalteromonas sp. JC28]|nr:hypothetical protein [Pseudoalteromonas sp. JC28]